MAIENQAERESLDERIAELVAEALFNHMARKGLLNGAETKERKSTEQPKQLVTVKELAQILRVKPSWIYEQTRLNAIPFIRIGKYVRFYPDQVLRFFEEKGLNRKEEQVG